MEPPVSRDDSLLTAAQKQFGDLTTDSQKSAMDAELALTESQDAEAATEALANVDVFQVPQQR